MMKRLLIVTAVIEVGAGLALICQPSAAVALLLGARIEAVAALGRVAGSALLALGVANWFARLDDQNCSARGLVIAMLLYNISVVFILTSVGMQSTQSQPVGPILWTAVLVHAVLSGWCCISLILEPKK